MHPTKQPRPLHHTFYEALHGDPNISTNRADRRRGMRYYQHGTGVRRKSMFTQEFNDLKAKVGFIALRQYIRKTVIHFLVKAKLRNGNKGSLSS